VRRPVAALARGDLDLRSRISSIGLRRLSNVKLKTVYLVLLVTLLLLASGPGRGNPVRGNNLLPPQNNSSAGAIAGLVGYPSDSLPPMRVYAISVDARRHYMTRTRANQSRFTIGNVLPGKYYLVAYTDEAPGMIGGWSRAVPCGLKVTCRNHSLIPVNVIGGSTARGIKVGDWYARGVFPAEPAPNRTGSDAPRIGSIDFRNFTYIRQGSESLVLRNGKEEGEGPDGSRLLSVSYVDFDGDGPEEALVTIATGRREGGGYSEEYYVYTNRGSAPQQVFHESREKPRGMTVNRRSIVIVAPLWRRNDPGCCPSTVETAIYSWRGSGFIRTSRRLKPSR
jgi:hypothetical protein